MDKDFKNTKRLTALERMKSFFDDGTFVEMESLVANKKSGVITGYGTINGRLIYAYSFDYDINGGIVNNINSKKICNIMDMAIKMGAPILQIYDSIGGELSENLNIFRCYGSIINRNVKLSGVVPQISIVCGHCTGLLALAAAMSDFTVMIKDKAFVYLSEPEDIEKNNNEYVSLEMYADSAHCSKLGNAQITASNEKEAIELVKKLFRYLPSNNIELPHKDLSMSLYPYTEIISHKQKYDTNEIVRGLLDKDSLIEINAEMADNIKTLLGSINGTVVGIAASSHLNNKLTIKDLSKITKFIKVCNCFNISFISLINCEGFLENLEQEKDGILLEATKTLAAICQASIPKVALIYGTCYGAIYTILAGKGITFDIVYAWPNSQICITNPEKLIKILYKEDILSSELPIEKERQILKSSINDVTSPYRAAEEGYIDDIILPEEMRQRIFSAIDMLQSKREIKYPKKHNSSLI